ncbi:unnamed protein product, partial [Iphiclides podalirius]
MAPMSTSPTTIVISIFLATILFMDSFQVCAYRAYHPARKRGNGTLTPVDKQTYVLFKILDEMPDNELFRAKSCGLMEQDVPDFKAPDRRISQVKCLEQLWKMRFYDQLLLKKVRCKADLDGAYVSFAIYKGDEVHTAKFPHAGAIGWKTVSGAWIFLCGSALISNRFMLTAAHCSRSSIHDDRVADPSPKIVRLGEFNILDSIESGKKPMDFYIKNFIVHDNYRYPYKYNDVAVIELENSVPFTLYSSASCIWPYDDKKLFGEAYETGWGIVESDETDSKPFYKVAKVNLIEQQTCSDILKERLNTSQEVLSSHKICANYASNDTYRGDSGGPLVMPILNPGFSDFTIHYIIGIETATSNSFDIPNIYTKASSFVDWIEDIVWKTEVPVKELLSERNFANIYGNL